MTGDGVNDTHAPRSDRMLLDDNVTPILVGIKAGRLQFFNLKTHRVPTLAEKEFAAKIARKLPPEPSPLSCRVWWRSTLDSSVVVEWKTENARPTKV